MNEHFIPVLLDLRKGMGPLCSGRVLIDAPDGNQFIGRFGNWIAFDLPKRIAERLSEFDQPVVLVDLTAWEAVDVRSGTEFPQIEKLPPSD